MLLIVAIRGSFNFGLAAEPDRERPASHGPVFHGAEGFVVERIAGPPLAIFR